MSSAGRHVVIVGGARGLGRGAVIEHLKRGWRVTATVRQADALDDLRSDQLSVIVFDTVDWPAVDVASTEIRLPIDRLFVIAGVTGPDAPIGDSDPDAFTHVMSVNALAPLRMIDRWDALVAPDGLVAIMSSSMGSVALNDSAGWETYRMSKAAMNMGLRSVAARRGDARTYVAINPGWVRTALGGDKAELSVEESIPRVVDVLDHHATNRGVHFLDLNDQTVPW